MRAWGLGGPGSRARYHVFIRLQKDALDEVGYIEKISQK